MGQTCIGKNCQAVGDVGHSPECIAEHNRAVAGGLIPAPWPDFEGNDLFEGDTIRHPSGEEGLVTFVPGRTKTVDQWLVDYGDLSPYSRLRLQINDRGQAVKMGVLK